MEENEVTNQDDNIQQANVENHDDLNSSQDENSGETENKAQEKSEELVLNNDGLIIWNDVAIAKLLPNQPLFAPKIELLGEELNREETLNVVSERLYSWLDEQIRSELYPLTRLKAAIEFALEPEVAEPEAETIAEVEAPIAETIAETETTQEEPVVEAVETKPAEVPKPKAKLPLSDIAKALAIKIHSANGILDRALAENDIQGLSQDNRRELRQIGIKFGRAAVYLPLLLKPKASRLNAILSHFSQGKTGEVAIPRTGVTSFNADSLNPDADYSLSGFKNIGGRVIRLDILDRVIDNLFEASKEAKGPITMPIAVVSLLGVSNDVAMNVVEGLGWEKQTDEEGNIKWSVPRRRPLPRPVRKEFNASDKKFEKKFEGASRPQNKDGFKKRKDKDIKPKRNHDFISREAKNTSDSPFAILAQLKADLGKNKE